MVVIAFRSRLKPGVEAEYAPRAAEMLGLAREMPGFVSIKDFVADDGERLALIKFRTLEQSRAWGQHPDHRIAQQQGRDRFFSEFSLTVCEVARESRFSA